MSWATAKARIKTVLEGVATIKRVYENPPNTLQDWPCFVIYPPAIENVQRHSGGWRITTYRARLRCITSDQDWDQAAARLDTIREATIDAFDLDTRLDANVTIIRGPTVEEAVQIPYGERTFLGFDVMLTIRDDISTTFGI